MRYSDNKKYIVRILACVFSAIYVLLVLIFTDRNWLLLLIGFVTLSAVVWLPEALTRSKCKRRLLKREPLDYVRLCENIAITTGRNAAEVERSWKMLAEFYKVPANRLLPTDALRDDLAGIVEDPDYHIFFLVGVREDVPSADNTTWKDLVLWYCDISNNEGSGITP